MNRHSSLITISCSILLGLAGNSLRADWKDEIGFTRLKALAGGSLPTTATHGLTQTEALESGLNYAPDTASSQFSSKTFILKSGASATSNHATRVAANFYGSGSLLPGSATVDLYSADDWLNAGFLNSDSSSEPLTESRAVQNHSWIYTPNPNSKPPAPALTETEVRDIDMRLDHAINRDGFICVVGQNNGSSNPLPQLLVQGYHSISVGRDDGNHSYGVTAHDVIGRIKPDIVAPSAFPENATSWTTPMVASAAGLLHARLSATPYSLTGADRPRVVKALLLASATKNTVPNWSNWDITSPGPLDDRYGAGELNIHHAWLAMSAGRKNSVNATHGIRGWAAESVSINYTRTYFFTIPASPVSTPFCAALTWHRVIMENLAGPPSNWGNLTASLADLNLRLHQASGFTVGAQIAESASTVDNVELIYQPTLAPGNYALVVQTPAAAVTPYALAWHSLPAVTIAATQPTAREIDGQQGSVTITRTGDTTLAMQVPLVIGGTAVSGTHYQALPSTVTIPAGQSSFALQVTPVSDSLEQGDRTVTVAVAADFALVRDAAQSAVVTIQDKPSFDVWRLVHFTAPELLDPLISGETADPDQDQLANLIEYGLGLDPKTPNLSPVILVEAADPLTLTTSKSPAASGITWRAEVSENLTSWAPAVIITNNTSTFTAQDNILINQADRRFIRLKITRP